MIENIVARALLPMGRQCCLLCLLLSAPLQAQTGSTQVIVSIAKQSEVIEEVPLTGTVIASRHARLSTEINGLLDSIQVDIGDSVNKGDVILTLKSEFDELVYKARQAESERARRELADARRRLDDAERLGRSNTVSVNEINSLKAEVSFVSADLTRLQAEQQQQQLRLRQHTLRAPFSGIISARMVEQGEWVSTGQPVVELVSLEDPRIEFQAPQWAYQRLDDVVRLPVRFDAIPEKDFQADIIAIAPVTDRASRTFLIRAALIDSNIALIPGISASATLHLRNADTGVVVDRNALIRYPDGRVTVWVVREVDGRNLVTEKQLQTGLSFNGKVNITDGLNAGEYVVVNGNESLREGQGVVIKQMLE